MPGWLEGRRTSIREIESSLLRGIVKVKVYRSFRVRLGLMDKFCAYLLLSPFYVRSIPVLSLVLSTHSAHVSLSQRVDKKEKEKKI